MTQNHNEIMYTVESPGAPDIPGEGKPRRHYLHADKPIAVHPEGATTLWENFLRGVSISGDSPFLGSRPLTNGVPGPYVWQTYNEIHKRVKNLAAGFAIRGLTPESAVGLFSINRPEWIIAEQASFCNNLITVPLYDTLGVEALEYIINQTELRLVTATCDKAKFLLQVKDKLPSLKHLVIMDTPDEALITLGREHDVEVISYLDLEREGAATPHLGSAPKPSDICTICYTSGTTGMPKGVMLAHSNLLSFTAATRQLVIGGSLVDYNKDDCYISYLPLAHVFERIVQVCLTYVGGRIGFYQGDTLKLLDDVQQSVKAKGGIGAILFNQAFSAKKAYLAQGYTTHRLWDNLVFNKVRARLGGKVRLMLTGAAPISGDVITFLRVCFSAMVCEGYGQTETSGGATQTDGRDLSSGHIGSPSPHCEVKLLDVPSMSYTSQDKPFPRGEILIRGANVFKGYYKSPEKTAETLDADGWCHTGDVGQWDANGRLQIIDRVKNIFKLAQGEYIAPEKIELVYQKHEIVAQSFVYGDSLQAVLVAVIVPDEDVFPTWVAAQGLPTTGKSFAELCADPEVTKFVLKQLETFGKAEGLKGFENIKSVHLSPTLLTPESGLMTPTFKLKRHEAKKHYQEHLTAMYASITQ
ncbi:hypothetical protein DFS34DRAFT_609930 [Phlyctochytrium arcticum]|nr:hypothetical protein DFS34DRAFT_609930 [Phlyctochytrium arcticum]